MADNTKAVWRFLRGKGLTPAQAAGVIGVMQQESGPGLNPKARNPSSGAYGIAQWLGGRKNAAVTSGDLHKQLNHLWQELQGPERGALSAIKQAHTIEDAAKAWLMKFERPGPNEMVLGRRIANARNVFNRLNGVAGDTSAATRGGNRSSGPSTRTITETTPGVDNSLARFQLVQDFLGSRSSDPLQFALQARELRDIPGTTTSRTVRTGSSRGGGGAPRPSSGGGDIPGLKGKGSGVFELFYDPQGGWKYGKPIGAIGGHSDHVHVAAGPKTIVALGKLAQQMGLHVGENPHFGGVAPVHTTNSFHYKPGGEAIDVSGDTAKMAAYARRVRRLYGLK